MRALLIASVAAALAISGCASILGDDFRVLATDAAAEEDAGAAADAGDVDATVDAAADADGGESGEDTGAGDAAHQEGGALDGGHEGGDDAAASDGSTDGGVANIPVYRLYDYAYCDHLFSANPQEGTPSYTLENSGNPVFYLAANTGPKGNFIPLYRCVMSNQYNHFLTTSVTCEGQVGALNEGTLGYLVAVPSDAGSLPCSATQVQRVSKQYTSGGKTYTDHIDTLSASELSVLQGMGYGLETSPGYAWSSAPIVCP